MPDSLVYADGEYADPTAVRVPLLDRGFLFGDGVFEALRTYRREPHGLGQHLARLRRSAAVLEIPVPWSDHELGRILAGGLERLPGGEVGIRVWVTRGSAGLSFEIPAKASHPALYMLFWRMTQRPSPVLTEGVAVVTIEGGSPRSHEPVKAIGSVASLVGQLAARRKEVFESIRVSTDERILEGARSNIFFVRGAEVVTPPTSDGLLDGVTRQTVIDHLRSEATPVRETSVTPAEIAGFDEIFLTRTSLGVVPVVRFDGRQVGDGLPGALTRRLVRWFAGKEVRG